MDERMVFLTGDDGRLATQLVAEGRYASAEGLFGPLWTPCATRSKSTRTWIGMRFAPPPLKGKRPSPEASTSN